MERTVSIPREDELLLEEIPANKDEMKVIKRIVDPEAEERRHQHMKNTRPRRKKEKNFQVTKDKVPMPGDSTSFISSWLMLYNRDHKDADFSRKACESLVKKLKDKNTDTLLKTLITAVATEGRDSTSCIPIVRTLDGRLQVAGKKGTPHVIYVKIFRNADLERKDLKHIRLCKHGYDMKKELNVCVNPWHYEKVVTHTHFQTITEKQMEETTAINGENIHKFTNSPSFTTEQLISSVQAQKIFEPTQVAMQNYMSLNPAPQLTYTTHPTFETEKTFQNSFSILTPSTTFDKDILGPRRDCSQEYRYGEPPPMPKLNLLLPTYTPSIIHPNPTPHFNTFDTGSLTQLETSVLDADDANNRTKSAFTTFNVNKKLDNATIPNPFLNSFKTAITNLPRLPPSIEEIPKLAELHPAEHLIQKHQAVNANLLDFKQMSHNEQVSSTILNSQTINGANRIIFDEKSSRNDVDVESFSDEPSAFNEEINHQNSKSSSNEDESVGNKLSSFVQNESDYVFHRPEEQENIEYSYRKRKSDGDSKQTLLANEGKQRKLNQPVDMLNTSLTVVNETKKSEKKTEENDLIKKSLERKCRRAISSVNSMMKKVMRGKQPLQKSQLRRRIDLNELPSAKIIRITEASEMRKRRLPVRISMKRGRCSYRGPIRFLQKIKERSLRKLSEDLEKDDARSIKLTEDFIEKRNSLGAFSNRKSKKEPNIDLSCLQPLEAPLLFPQTNSNISPTSHATFTRSKPSTSTMCQQTAPILTQSAVQSNIIENVSQVNECIPSSSTNSQKMSSVPPNDNPTSADPLRSELAVPNQPYRMTKNFLAIARLHECVLTLRETNIIPKIGESSGNPFVDFMTKQLDVLMSDSQQSMGLTDNSSASNSEPEAESSSLMELIIIDSSLKTKWQKERMRSNGTTQRIRNENASAHMWNIHLPRLISRDMNQLLGINAGNGINEYIQEHWATFKYSKDNKLIDVKEAHFNSMFIGVSFARPSSTTIESACKWKGVCGIVIFISCKKDFWLKNYSCCSVLINMPVTSKKEPKKSYKVYPGSQFRIFELKKFKKTGKKSEPSQEEETKTEGIKISFLQGNSHLCVHSNSEIQVQVIY